MIFVIIKIQIITDGKNEESIPIVMTFREKLRRRLTEQNQMSESFVLSLILAFSGGFQDAYTYIVRQHVFANAQTGNIVLMSTNFLAGQWHKGLRYLLPVLAFIFGVFIAEQLDHFFHASVKFHWRQLVLILEILILIGVGFIPLYLNTLANTLVSFSCAMQVQAFRTVGGNAYASTMCIGNLRSGTQALSTYLRERDRRYLLQVKDYFGVILVFALGAGAGGNICKDLGERSIWISACILVIGCLLMGLDRPLLLAVQQKETECKE